MRHSLSALLAACAVAACSRASGQGAAGDAGAAARADELGVLREASRELLDRNCGECHTSTLPTALPRALRVYDLVELDWSRRMSDAQLRSADSRLHEPIAPTLGEGEARPVRASAEELARFRRYVELEVQRRSGVGGAR